MSNFVNYKEIVKLFVKLGCISFGGPAVHIAMMEQEVVENRKWMSREHFLDLVGATNIIPGPNSYRNDDALWVSSRWMVGDDSCRN